MRIIFMGTPAFAVPALQALIAAGHEIIAVYTRAPQPAGRGKPMAISAVQQTADALGIPVRTPHTLRAADAQAAFSALDADIAVVAAYGLILPQAILDMPMRGCLNIHGSLLPRWRGAAPVQRAILAGDTVTGVTIMQMEAGLDSGPMILTETTSIDAKTAGELTTELSVMGARLMVAALAGDIVGTPQPVDGVTLAPKIDKAEARLDLSQPAKVLERAIRAYNPVPGGFVEIAGIRLKILAADVVPGLFSAGVIVDDRLLIGTGDGALRPTVVQRPGKPAMAVAAMLNGWSVPAGTLVI